MAYLSLGILPAGFPASFSDRFALLAIYYHQNSRAIIASEPCSQSDSGLSKYLSLHTPSNSNVIINVLIHHVTFRIAAVEFRVGPSYLTMNHKNEHRNGAPQPAHNRSDDSLLTSLLLLIPHCVSRSNLQIRAAHCIVQPRWSTLLADRAITAAGPAGLKYSRPSCCRRVVEASLAHRIIYPTAT